MSISYPSVVFTGGLSAVYTSGSITGSGESGNEIRLKNDITVVSLAASSVSASEYIVSGPFINANPKISVTSSTEIVDAVTSSTRGAKYTLMAETTTGTYHVQTCDLLLANNGSTVLITPYAVVSTSGTYLVNFDAQINGGSIELLASKVTSENVTITMTKTYLS